MSLPKLGRLKLAPRESRSGSLTPAISVEGRVFCWAVHCRVGRTATVLIVEWGDLGVGITKASGQPQVVWQATG
jgi:hypothetical protein